MMFITPIRRFLLLLLLLMLAPPVCAQGPVVAPSAATGPTSEVMAAELGRRLETLQGLLNAVRDAHGEPLRQVAMERHWKEMQDYMAASLKLAVRKAEVGESAADCSVVGSRWTGLSFPGQVRSDDYLKSMQAHMSRMREELVGMHGAHDADELNAALQTHWRNNYQLLQKMRGLDWMFAGWTPAQPANHSLPAPESEGAKLTQTYCSICHAVPSTRLHTAAEWTTVMSTMIRHITLSDTAFPMCVQVPSGDEITAIGNYLAKYAR